MLLWYSIDLLQCSSAKSTTVARSSVLPHPTLGSLLQNMLDNRTDAAHAALILSCCCWFIAMQFNQKHHSGKEAEAVFYHTPPSLLQNMSSTAHCCCCCLMLPMLLWYWTTAVFCNAVESQAQLWQGSGDSVLPHPTLFAPKHAW